MNGLHFVEQSLRLDYFSPILDGSGVENGSSDLYQKEVKRKPRSRTSKGIIWNYNAKYGGKLPI